MLATEVETVCDLHSNGVVIKGGRGGGGTAPEYWVTLFRSLLSNISFLVTWLAICWIHSKQSLICVNKNGIQNLDFITFCVGEGLLLRTTCRTGVCTLLPGVPILFLFLLYCTGEASWLSERSHKYCFFSLAKFLPSMLPILPYSYLFHECTSHLFLSKIDVWQKQQLYCIITDADICLAWLVLSIATGCDF